MQIRLCKGVTVDYNRRNFPGTPAAPHGNRRRVPGSGNSLERQGRNQRLLEMPWKKHTENTGKISSVFSVQNSVAKNLCFCEKDRTVGSTKGR